MANMLLSSRKEILLCRQHGRGVFLSILFGITVERKLEKYLLTTTRKVAVLACMDARLDPARALGLEEGDAHVIRNAGGRALDAVRSLVISQQLLGTREIVILHHVRQVLYSRT
jgi:hypothetical protein